MANLADIKIYLSGGASQSNANGSLGGAISSTQVLSQTATGLTTITGITINDAYGNAEGNGTLSYNATNKTLQWTPPSGSAGTAVDVGTTSGTYAIQGGSNGGALIVTSVAASLPGSNVSNTLTIANRMNLIFDDTSRDESDVGNIDYRCLYLKNTHASQTIKEVKLWIGANTPGEDTIHVGLDPAGAGGTATKTTTTVSAASWAAGVATLTTTVPHGGEVGDWVLVEGISPSGYNGVFQLTAGTTGSTLKYAMVADPGAYVSGGTVAGEWSEPSDVSFTTVAVDSASALSLGSLAAGQAYPFWIKRLTPVGVAVAVMKNTFRLAFSAKV